MKKPIEKTENKTLFIFLFIGLIFLTISVCSSSKTAIEDLKPLTKGHIVTGLKAVDKLSAVYDAYNREFTPLEEYYIGQDMAAILLKKYRSYGDGHSLLEKYISAIGNTLAMTSDRPETYQGYRFIILCSPSVNVISVPSGFIFVTTGLIQTASNEDELAGVLAHGVMRVVLKHSLKSISEAQKNKAFNELMKFGVRQASSKDKKLADLTELFEGIIDEVNKSVQIGYDSKRRIKADRSAVSLLVRTGYDPRGLSALLRKLQTNMPISIQFEIRAKRVDTRIKEFNRRIPIIIDIRTKRFRSILNKSSHRLKSCVE